MGTRRMIGRWAVLFIAVVVGGVVAGAVVGAQFQPALSEDLLAARQSDPLVKVADIPAAANSAGRGVFVQPTGGLLCLWDAPSAASLTKQGGCNPADDPLIGRRMMISFAYDGGPAIRDVTDARLVGIVSLDVTTVQIAMTDGTRRSVKLKQTAKIAGLKGSFRAFGYRFKRSDFKQGLGPTAVIGFNAAGNEIYREETGFVN
jgi:hypothetical protein